MHQSSLCRTMIGVALAAGLAGCDSTKPSPAPAAPPTPVVAAPPSAAVVAPPWMREPRDDADRALLARLLDTDSDVRKAAVDEWEAARQASWDIVFKLPRDDWPLPQMPRGDWPAAHQETPPHGESAQIVWAFENRTRALARGLIAALRDSDAATRAAAATSMGGMRLPAGARWVEALSDPAPEVRVAAAQALAEQKYDLDSKYPDCFDEMVELLTDRDWRVREAGLRGMLAYRDDDARHDSWGVRMAMARLLESTRDDHAEVRVAALSMIDAAQTWTRLAADVPGIFAEALEDSDAAVRSRAARFFADEVERGDAAPPSAEVLATLHRMLVAPDREERRAAAFAVWRTTRDASAVVGIYAEQVAESRGSDLVEPLQVLAEMGPDAESVVPAVLSILTENTPFNLTSGWNDAICALYSIGAPSATTLPPLKEMLDAPDMARRVAAASAIVTLDGDDAARDAVLARSLTLECDPMVRAAIHQARAAIGAGGDELVADLIRGLRGSPDETTGAIEGLRRLGRRAAAATTGLEAVVANDPDEYTRTDAAAALASIGGPARAAELLPRVRAWGPNHDYSIVRVLAAAGPADAAALPVLFARLDESPVEIARALAGIGPAARDALPRLEARMRSADVEQGIAAAEAVLRIGGDRRAALEVLVGALEPSRGTWDDLYDPAAWALARSGDAARPVVQALRDAMTPVSDAPDYGVVAALVRVTDGAEPDASQIEWTVKYSQAKPPIDFVEALGASGPAAARWTSSLEQVALQWRTKDEDTDLCRAAIRALGQIGPGAASALPSLRRLRRNALLRAAAEEAIRRIEGR